MCVRGGVLGILGGMSNEGTRSMIIKGRRPPVGADRALPGVAAERDVRCGVGFLASRGGASRTFYREGGILRVGKSARIQLITTRTKQ